MRSFEVFLTKTEVNRIGKSKRDGTGTDIKISQAGIRKQEGGSIISSLMPMMSKVGAMALPWLSKAAAPIATGALSGLSSLGINKLFGNGIFSIPQDKVDKLIRYKDHLTDAQKKQVFAVAVESPKRNLSKTHKKVEICFLII